MSDVVGEDGEIYITAKCKGNMEVRYCGKEWSDGAGGQVKQVCIWHGYLIYGIQVSYERNGKFCLSPRHGGTEGDFEQVKSSLSLFKSIVLCLKLL
ncbi:putative jacalin-like lectin domain-containing protein [Dioscorea sansibarensis]